MNKEFSFSTIRDFDDHISKSITGYDLLYSLIDGISTFFIKDKTVVVDLGCTTGLLANKLSEKEGVKSVYGYDIIGNQFVKTKPNVKFIVQDITDESFFIPNNNLTLMVFTLQFIEISKRQCVLNKVYESLNTNGAFIFCEKEISSNGIIQEVFTFSNYSNKLNHFSPVEILEKEKTLRRIMNSLESVENVKMLKKAGFKVIETFFKSLNFKGYLCKK